MVRTDTTMRVDYNSSAVWGFEGDKLTVINDLLLKQY
jgi:hypothetical protein